MQWESHMDALEAVVDLSRFAEAFDLLLRFASVGNEVTECASSNSNSQKCSNNEEGTTNRTFLIRPSR